MTIELNQELISGVVRKSESLMDNIENLIQDLLTDEDTVQQIMAFNQLASLIKISNELRTINNLGFMSGLIAASDKRLKETETAKEAIFGALDGSHPLLVTE